VQLQQLRYFVTVAETRHFTRAAQAVHVAQPSLSKQIHTLERELGAPLFSRARGNVALTPAGEALLPLARRVLADTENAQRQVQELVGLARGRLRLGATPSLSTVLLPGALRRFRDAYPGIELRVEESGSRDLVGLLAHGELDLALIIVPLHAHDPALATMPILREPLVVAAPADGSAIRAKSLRVRDLARYPLVMFRDGYDLRDVTLAACRRARVDPHFAIEGGEMDAVLRFVEAGLGVAVVPSMVLDGRPGLQRISLTAPGLTRTIALAHRRDVDPPGAARAFRSMLLEQLADAAHSGRLPAGVARRRVRCFRLGVAWRERRAPGALQHRHPCSPRPRRRGLHTGGCGLLRAKGPRPRTCRHYADDVVGADDRMGNRRHACTPSSGYWSAASSTGWVAMDTISSTT
jgi:DNA-binding transcriptional LysR family regulator